MNKYDVKDFSLFHTLDCGQFFLYKLREDNFYEIINGPSKFIVKQEKDILYYQGISKNDLVSFFGLNEDIDKLLENENDEHLLLAIEKYWGLRLMKQDLWQTIISFVCSSASNIPKIKMNLRLIIEKFSCDGTFPKSGSLNNLEKLKECKTGYRAKFIYSINQAITENPNLLFEISNSDYKTSKKLLMELDGIGSKVADCICLFALNHKEAFPIDTWVKQIIEKLYLKREAKNLKEIEEYIKSNFNKGNIGLKQQYLFHYARLNLKSQTATKNFE